MVSVKIFYCVDLGDDWDKAILDKSYEVLFLHTSFIQSCECYQIGGSTNLTNVIEVPFEYYYRDDSGIKKLFNGSKFSNHSDKLIFSVFHFH